MLPLTDKTEQLIEGDYQEYPLEVHFPAVLLLSFVTFEDKVQFFEITPVAILKDSKNKWILKLKP